tara:strand:- start:18126 stop:18569 length:444 start_codon:yes stop_codon:yes gene_type:complete
MSSKNSHLLGKKLFAAIISNRQETYKEHYTEHLENFIDTGDRVLSRLFNSLSEADIVQHFYTQTPCIRNITRLFPLHENEPTPWIPTKIACEELQNKSKAFEQFQAALNIAHMDIKLDIVESNTASKHTKPRYHFAVKFTDYNAHSL